MNSLNKSIVKLQLLKITGLISFNTFLLILIIFNSYNFTILFAQDCKSEITIRTNKPSSLIYFNNEFVGYGNAVINVGKGKFTILLKEKKFGWNSQEINDTLVVNECGEKKELVYQFKNNFYVSSDPQDAGVFVSDSLLGYTPLTISSFYPELNIKRKEYRNENFSLNNSNKFGDIKLLYLGKKNEENFLQTNLFKILVGTAILFGGTSAYYKLKADDNFDQYNNTNIQDYLNKTHRYDTISGIMFGALQLNFAALIYFFLVD